ARRHGRAGAPASSSRAPHCSRPLGRRGASLGTMRARACLILLLGACAASRDHDRRGPTEPRAAASGESVAALAWGEHTRPRRSPFGVVVHREIGLGDASFVLAVARSCRETPRPPPPRDVVLDSDAEAAHCRVGPYHGPLAIALRRPDGRWWQTGIE